MKGIILSKKNEFTMVRKILFWVISIAITLFTAVYQRMTGPTYPKQNGVIINGITHSFKLPRSTNNTSDFEVKIDIPDPEVSGYLIYKRFNTNDPPDTLTFSRKTESLAAFLPGQPAAGKLEYQVVLIKNGEQLKLLDNQTIIIRFKGNVPAFVLIPHILFIFAAMLLSTLTGFFALGNIPSYRFYTGLTLIMFLTGGMILGPVVQHYAFGELWTGFPFGKDLTDNKVLIASIFWIIAWAGNRKTSRRYLVILAALVNLSIGLIPHSARGSELDYSSGEIKTGMIFVPFH